MQVCIKGINCFHFVVSLITFNAQLFASGYDLLCNKKSGYGSAEKNCLTQGFIKVSFSSLASDLYILLHWVLVRRNKEIRTLLTSLGKADFLGKEAQVWSECISWEGKKWDRSWEKWTGTLSAHYSNSGVWNGTWES